MGYLALELGPEKSMALDRHGNVLNEMAELSQKNPGEEPSACEWSHPNEVDELVVGPKLLVSC